MGWDEDRRRGYNESYKGYVPDNVENRDAYRAGMRQAQATPRTVSFWPKPSSSSSSWSPPSVPKKKKSPPSSGDESEKIGVRPFFRSLVTLIVGLALCAISYQLYVPDHKISWVSGLLGLAGGGAVVVGGIGVILNLLVLAVWLGAIAAVVAAIVFAMGKWHSPTQRPTETMAAKASTAEIARAEEVAEPHVQAFRAAPATQPAVGPGPIPSVTGRQTPRYAIVNTETDPLRLRSCPVTCPIIGWVPKGSPVKVVGTGENGWLEIEATDVADMTLRGFADGKLLK